MTEATSGAEVTVIGGGLAGCEAVYQLARRGVRVRLHEMRPVRTTEAHATDRLAELVCSNSLRDDSLVTAVGVLLLVTGVDGVVVVGDELLDGENVVGGQRHGAAPLVGLRQHSVTVADTRPRHGSQRRQGLGRADHPRATREDLRPPRRSRPPPGHRRFRDHYYIR